MEGHLITFFDHLENPGFHLESLPFSPEEGQSRTYKIVLREANFSFGWGWQLDWACLVPFL